MTKFKVVPFRKSDIPIIDEDIFNFKRAAFQNGHCVYVYAYDYMRMLGYKSDDDFREIYKKAWDVCVAIEVDPRDDFERESRCIDGVEKNDLKLSIFACYLIAIVADVNIGNVNKARIFFSKISSHINRYIDDPEEVERVLIREKISLKEKSVFAAASKLGLSTEAIRLFQSAGYHGLYGMHLTELKKNKGFALSSRSLLDFMCDDELLANYFRLDRLDVKLKSGSIRSQRIAEDEARATGESIRSSLIKESGCWPEDFDLVEDVRKVKTSLKQIRREMKKIVF